MIVIADDITGAAEIAGIASEQGFPVQLLCAGGDAVGCDVVATSGVTVIATDTRSMSEEEAVAETRRIASSFLISHSSFLIFKKTDSALRGYVVAELKALMAATGYERAVYLPANPSKGRIIRQGVYYIKEVREVPIAETAFSYDREFPATPTALEERFPDARKNGIVMPDAESEEHIRSVVAQYNDGKTLLRVLPTCFMLYYRPVPVPSLLWRGVNTIRTRKPPCLSSAVPRRVSPWTLESPLHPCRARFMTAATISTCGIAKFMTPFTV